MVQHARGVDHVERARAQAGLAQIGLDEAHAAQAEAPRRGRAQLERGARQIRADHHAIRARQVQAHLPGAAAQLDDARVAGDRLVEQPRELAALRARAQSGQAVARRIAGKRRRLVELAHHVGAFVRGQAQLGDSARRLVARAAATRELAVERAGAGGTGEQLGERVDHEPIRSH